MALGERRCRVPSSRSKPPPALKLSIGDQERFGRDVIWRPTLGQGGTGSDEEMTRLELLTSYSPRPGLLPHAPALSHNHYQPELIAVPPGIQPPAASSSAYHCPTPCRRETTRHKTNAGSADNLGLSPAARMRRLRRGVAITPRYREFAAGVLVLTVLALAQRGRLLSLPAAINSPAGRRQALEEGPGPAHWEGVPDLSLAVAMPSWAGCPRPPCQYGQIADGAVNASVSSGPPHSRRGTHRLTA